jgi:hypothetical protein
MGQQNGPDHDQSKRFNTPARVFAPLMRLGHNQRAEQELAKLKGRLKF